MKTDLLNDVEAMERETIVTRCLNMVTDNEYLLKDAVNPKDIRRLKYNISFFGSIAKLLSEQTEPKVINVNIQHLVKEITNVGFASADSEKELTAMLVRIIDNAQKTY